MSCDLHNHSTCSDGSVPIQRLPGIAARTGLHAIAISDHDTTLSAAYCYAHPRQEGVELIPAVELTGYDFERQHRVHLLCYYPNLDCVPLREHCEIMKRRRNACGLQTVHELEAMYPQFTEELVWETAAESGVIYKSGIMQVLGELGLSDCSIYGVSAGAGSAGHGQGQRWCSGVCAPHRLQEHAAGARTGGRRRH